MSTKTTAAAAKTQTQTQTQPATKARSVFTLSNTQLKAVAGGLGGIAEGPH